MALTLQQLSAALIESSDEFDVSMPVAILNAKGEQVPVKAAKVIDGEDGPVAVLST